MRLLFCEACDRRITVEGDEEFHRTEEGAGPYCDACWFFVRRIEALQYRVADLEKEVRKSKPVLKGASPYDASVKR
jgi:hypothetical protein